MNQQNSETAKKNKLPGYIFKGCLWGAGIITIITAACIIMLVAILDGDKTERERYGQEKTLRENALETLRGTVQEYYNSHATYPSHKLIRSIQNEKLQEYLSSRVLRYYINTDPTGHECYVIEFIDDVRLGWSGYRYSNNPECIGLPKETIANKNGTYSNILDLH
ncbi:MAG: hypothetical protein HUN04_05910 [Desulfobacter sp.]|nr:MAG: hypothetical protein HUN04_05910 [Desulfobacter sp.]